MRHTPIRVETDVCGAPGWVAGDVFYPDSGTELKNTLIVCLPGGGVTRAYFNIPGSEQFSFVRAMTGHGFICASFDHPGCGESSIPEDGYALDAPSIAAADAVAVRHVQTALREGTLTPALPNLPQLVSIGLGHSMGAMIITLQQSSSPLYSAVALLCFTTRGLPEVLTETEQAVAAQPHRTPADFARLAQARFGEPFPTVAQSRANSPAAIALAQVQGKLAATSALQSMLPGNVAADAATIAAPIFLAAGDRDLTGPPHAIPAAFTASTDIRLVVVPNCGHHPFVTAGAPRLYRLLAAWADQVPAA